MKKRNIFSIFLLNFYNDQFAPNQPEKYAVTRLLSVLLL